MATTLTKLAASPNMLRYTLLGDSANELTNKTAVQVIADCAPGPLKALLQKADADGDSAWSAQGKTDSRVSIIAGGASGLTTGTTADAVAAFEALSPDTRTLQFKVQKVGTLPCVIELRFNNSINQ